MRPRAQLISLVSLLLMTQPADAYGPIGHKIVGRIAAEFLCVSAAREVAALLGKETLAGAGRWPDWIRSDPQWGHTRSWHYVNVDDHQTVMAVAGQPGVDVVWAIDRFRREVANPRLSRRSRAQALRFLAHFIADVHQPLHVGRAGDRGGNEIDVSMDGKTINLHKFWDAQNLLKRDLGVQQYGIGEQDERIRKRVKGNWVASPGDPVAWAAESKLLRGPVYDLPGTRSAAELSEGYQARALTITLDRLAAASGRLAGVINEAFCAGSKAP